MGIPRLLLASICTGGKNYGICYLKELPQFHSLQGTYFKQNKTKNIFLNLISLAFSWFVYTLNERMFTGRNFL